MVSDKGVKSGVQRCEAWFARVRDRTGLRPGVRFWV